MEQKLFTELRALYETSSENRSDIRIRLRMRDLIEPSAFHMIAFAFYDNIATRHTYHEIHLDKGLQRFAFEDGMMLIFLDYIEFLRLQT